MENISEDLGEQIISQLRELIRLLEIKLKKQKVVLICSDINDGSQ